MSVVRYGAVPMLVRPSVVAFGHRMEDRGRVTNVVSLQDDVGLKLGVYRGVAPIVMRGFVVEVADG